MVPSPLLYVSMLLIPQDHRQVEFGEASLIVAAHHGAYSP